MPNRRKFIATGLGVAAAPLLRQVAFGAHAAGSDEAVGKTPSLVRAWGAASATSPMGAMEIQRRAVGPHDVLLAVLYCGICHSDIHQVRDEWSSNIPAIYPCVPGHEIIGRVLAVGHAVTKFKG